jgi:hypothetical protein
LIHTGLAIFNFAASTPADVCTCAKPAPCTRDNQGPNVVVDVRPLYRLEKAIAYTRRQRIHLLWFVESRHQDTVIQFEQYRIGHVMFLVCFGFSDCECAADKR